ncbi:hypothetical protein CcCBS67573_g10517 [Chytriomyces confervae]|uniref:NmrA-like domain-containing protein n=1 Tax=Chytriomyces confervae TaxID=246404 RepID=A0A507CT81_9FUNG|nr:hypothetical protein CcCBS67573_g10517 [Chytriomyces confervae]
MSAFKNIAVVGGTSEIGQDLIKNLLATKAEFDSIILLTRDPDSVASKALTAAGAEARKIPSELSAAAIPALVEALKRVDVLVSIVGAQALADQVHLIHASVQAGVKRFFPSEFGVDLDLQGSTIPFLGVKVPIRQLLRSEEISSKLEHTFVENGYFMDGFFSSFFGWEISGTSVAVNIPGTGDVPVTVTLQSDVARFLAEILRADPAISRNKTLKFEGDRFTFNQAREIVSKAVIHVPGVKSTFSTTFTAVDTLEKRFETAEGYERAQLQMLLATVRGQGLLSHNHNKLFPNVKPTSAKEYIATLF